MNESKTEDPKIINPYTTHKNLVAIISQNEKNIYLWIHQNKHVGMALYHLMYNSWIVIITLKLKFIVLVPAKELIQTFEYM